MSTIVETAVSNPDFSTLVTALKAANLVSALEGDGPFTVFAPTNAAFAKVDPNGLTALLADTEKLTKVLTYHVVSGKVMASDVINLTSAKTLEGSELAIAVKDGTVHIGGATVVAADVVCDNGVIHVIDAVLMPTM
jgi:uncharacterized surface protein with fasciclin (FAS1) repeats